jgi:hypothetical protein
VLPDESLELGHEVFVIRFCQLATDVSDESLPAVFFIELNGHVGLLLVPCVFKASAAASGFVRELNAGGASGRRRNTMYVAEPTAAINRATTSQRPV